jgi:hypothetical protein
MNTVAAVRKLNDICLLAYKKLAQRDGLDRT